MVHLPFKKLSSWDGIHRISHSVESEIKQIYNYINGKLSDILQKSMGFYVLRKR